MQVNLGEKIRELRKRDGRTQEDLALALNVTVQAVSRWELGKGYPDIQLIPIIANYFHVAIDTLFGYESDRIKKLNETVSKAEYILRENMSNAKNMCSLIEFLRETVRDYPGEWRPMYYLAVALQTDGISKLDKNVLKANGKYMEYNEDANMKNTQLVEAASLYERILDIGASPDFRPAILMNLTKIYAILGKTKKAERLANAQDPMIISKEILLTIGMCGEKQDIGRGKAICSLLWLLTTEFMLATTFDFEFCKSESAVRHLLALVKLYNVVFEDGNYGLAHSDMRVLYCVLARLKAQSGNKDEALEYFNMAFEHEQKLNVIRQEHRHHYTAPLVSKLSFDPQNMEYENFIFKTLISHLPKSFVEELKRVPKYNDYFQSEMGGL